MQIDLPQDLVERIQKRRDVEKLESDAEAIRKALDALEWQDRERQAIQAGIDAWRASDTQDIDAFDAEFRAQNGIRRAEK
jgi:Arc/MetJ-type ribon-helix-helix transcriptional regulator